MSIFVQSSNSKQPKTKILAVINKVNFAREGNLPYCMYLEHHCITLPKNHILLANMWLMFPVFDLTHGKYWIFNQVQVMGFQILQDYVIDVSCFQICSILSLNVILCWEAHFLGWLPDFYIALQAFNVFYIFLPCLIFWKCCFSLCRKKWLILLKNK